MSRVSRAFFDRLRRWGMPSAQLPYDSKEWWDKSYVRAEGHPIEWGGVGLAELAAHEWAPEGANFSEKGALRAARLADDDLAGLARRPGGALLVLGGGTSRLSQDLQDAGWPSVLDVDISSEAIRQAQERVAKEGGSNNSGSNEGSSNDDSSDDGSSSSDDGGGGGLEFALADARTMRPGDLQGRTFDSCIDKGLVDALWCAGTAAAPRDVPRVSASVAAMLKPAASTASSDSSSSASTPTAAAPSDASSTWLVLSYSGPEDLVPLLAGAPGSPLSQLWASVDSRQLRWLWLYVLRRSARPFREAIHGDLLQDASGGDGSALNKRDVKKEARARTGQAMRQRRNRSSGSGSSSGSGRGKKAPAAR